MFVAKIKAYLVALNVLPVAQVSQGANLNERETTMYLGEASSYGVTPEVALESLSCPTVLPVEFYNRIMGIETLKPAAPLAAAQVVTPEATPAPVTPEPELVKASEPAMEEEPQEEEVKETEETLDDGDAPAPAEEPEQELGQIDTGFEASGKD